VALGTVSDVMPMGCLNRVLVREGLQSVQQGQDKNILRFMRGAGIADPTKINESDIAFRLGPIINAPGRLGDSVAWAFLSGMQGEVEKPGLEKAITETLEELHEAKETLKSEEQKAKEANLQKWREANPDKIRHEEKKPSPLSLIIPILTG
jgi:single-stranded-DNA-specific exonuclease